MFKSKNAAINHTPMSSKSSQSKNKKMYIMCFHYFWNFLIEGINFYRIKGTGKWIYLFDLKKSWPRYMAWLIKVIFLPFCLMRLKKPLFRLFSAKKSDDPVSSSNKKTWSVSKFPSFYKDRLLPYCITLRFWKCQDYHLCFYRHCFVVTRNQTSSWHWKLTK